MMGREDVKLFLRQPLRVRHEIIVSRLRRILGCIQGARARAYRGM